MKNYSAKSTTPPQSELTTSSVSVSTNTSYVVDVVKPLPHSKSETKQLENAVYSHIQAVRALGRTTITTYEIAKALSLPNHIVVGIVEKLKAKGVYPVA